jgi:two-component system phosphate regulon sensor histidine kinase PhoR
VRTRIFVKLLVAAAIVIAVATVTLDFAVRRSWEASLRQQITLSLTQKAELFAHEVQDVNHSRLQQDTDEISKAANARATVIDSSGKVLADSNASPPEMENHATRPEFIAALQGRVGSNARRSHTLGIEFLYVAAPIHGGAVRLAYPLTEIRQTVGEVRKTLIEASLFALAMAMLLAILVANVIAQRFRRIMRFAEGIASGELSTRIADHSSDEIGQVASALDKTARRLEDTFHELQNSRNQLETLLNSVQEPVIAISPDQKVLWSNGAFSRLLPQFHIRDSLIEMIRDPEVLEAVQASLEAHDARSAKARTLAPGRVFQCTVAPMPSGAVLVFHDLTEIERVEKTRRDFIANVSHELRTPLTSIQGYTETLLDSTPRVDDPTREFLLIIRQNATRMARLTDDLLKLARVESGEWKLELSDVAASALLSDAEINLRPTAAQHQKKLSIESTSEQQVVADPDAIQQVFTNLIENACKYAPAETQIWLGVNERGNQLEFYVRDSGPGIAAEHHGRLFERFYRVDKARSREAGGTGLGLAIVKHIVLNHGGTVRMESIVGHGSTFLFTLPRALTATHEEDAPIWSNHIDFGRLIAFLEKFRQSLI